jgi:tetratricopeptide (TPR) repeat protein
MFTTPKENTTKRLSITQSLLPFSIKILGGEHPNVATSYNNLGSIYKSKGEYDKAIEYYTKSLAIR